MLLDLETAQERRLRLGRLATGLEEPTEPPQRLRGLGRQLDGPTRVLDRLRGPLQTRQSIAEVEPARGVVARLDGGLEHGDAVLDAPQVHVLHAEVVERREVLRRHLQGRLERRECLQRAPRHAMQLGQGQVSVDVARVGRDGGLVLEPGIIGLAGPELEVPRGDQRAGRVAPVHVPEDVHGVIERDHLAVRDAVRALCGAHHRGLHHRQLELRVGRSQAPGRLERHRRAGVVSLLHGIGGEPTVNLDQVLHGAPLLEVLPGRPGRGDEQHHDERSERDRCSPHEGSSRPGNLASTSRA